MVGGPLQGHTDWVYSVAFSPDGKHVVSGSRDNSIRIWDAETQEVVGGPLLGHTDRVNSVAFSPDGRHIVSGSNDHRVRIWYVETQEGVGRPFFGHSNDVTSVAFLPDGKRIISGSRDGTVRIWDAGMASSVKELSTTTRSEGIRIEKSRAIIEKMTGTVAWSGLRIKRIPKTTGG
jgi:WD40 repeat protein